jgi:hypothetical protein
VVPARWHPSLCRAALNTAMPRPSAHPGWLTGYAVHGAHRSENHRGSKTSPGIGDRSTDQCVLSEERIALTPLNLSVGELCLPALACHSDGREVAGTPRSHQGSRHKARHQGGDKPRNGVEKADPRLCSPTVPGTSGSREKAQHVLSVPRHYTANTLRCAEDMSGIAFKRPTTYHI